MKATLWAFFFSLVMATTAKAQQPAFPTATNITATYSTNEIAELFAKAEKGDAKAQVKIAWMYEVINTPQHYSEAAKWYRKAAEQDDAVAQYHLGRMYDAGRGVAEDHTEAVKWLRKAAEQGNTGAQCLLGVHCFNGDGIPQDYAEAVKWERKAAEKGEAAAQYELGVCYKNGRGVVQDYAEAMKWYRKAAEQGDPMAQYNLAHNYESGDGVTQDYAEAVKWYRKAAEQGQSAAQYNLALCYDDGRGVAQDYTESVKWFRKAAEQGDEDAQYNLGWCYSKGNGVTQDYTESAKWYRKAAEQGLAIAQYNLGVYCDLGKGVKQDSTEAVEWYRKAAEQGDAEAQNNLGVCYENGDGVIRDYVQAYKWDNLAAAQGETNSKQYLSILEQRMAPEQIAEAQRLARDFKPSKAAHSAPSLPGVEPADLSPTSSGTGCFITEDGFLVTAAHVVNGANQIRLVTRTGLLIARLVKLDAANDLALLKAEGQFSALPIVSSRAVKLGSTIATIGYPNVGLQGFAPKFAKGEIASLTGPQDDPRYFQISAPVQPGNSGGALVDDRGNVVGVVSSKLDAATALAASGALPENVNYAIKSSFLLSFLESVPEVSAKMKEPGTKEEKFEDVVKSAEQAAILILVY